MPQPRPKASGFGAGRRDVRVAVGTDGLPGGRRTGRVALGRAARMAQAIARRYAAVRERRGGAGMVLRRPAAPVTQRPVRHETRVLVAPRLELTLAIRREADGLVRIGRPLEPAPRRGRVRLVGPAAGEALVRRLVQRGERGAPDSPPPRWEPRRAATTGASMPQVPGGAATPAAARAPTVRAVPRVVVQSPATAAAPVVPGDAPAPGRGRGAPPEGGWSPPGQPGPGRREVGRAQPGSGGAPATAVDVARLTDEVVRAIDRRLVAHRERLGRL
jgi:hypothetical protein